MRRVSIGMIEAVLLIKYRNTQPDSTAVLRKEYCGTLRTVLQYFLRSTGRCLSHLSKSLLPRPGRVSWRLLASLLGIGVAAWCVMYGIVPRQLFPAPCSTLLYSAEGELLGARIAPDGQWRFPRRIACLINSWIACSRMRINGSFTIRYRPRRHLPGDPLERESGACGERRKHLDHAIGTHSEREPRSDLLRENDRDVLGALSGNHP